MRLVSAGAAATRAACLAGNPPSLAETEEKKNTHEASHLGPKFKLSPFVFCCFLLRWRSCSRRVPHATKCHSGPTELVSSSYNRGWTDSIAGVKTNVMRQSESRGCRPAQMRCRRIQVRSLIRGYFSVRSERRAAVRCSNLQPTCKTMGGEFCCPSERLDLGRGVKRATHARFLTLPGALGSERAVGGPIASSSSAAPSGSCRLGVLCSFMQLPRLLRRKVAQTTAASPLPETDTATATSSTAASSPLHRS